tara:strand:+ start:797 stop:1519 length:723 start_codon:yes stop_codon:yes gene_type:complete
MNRALQVSYCKACKHGEFELQKGFYCGLINDLPTFIKTCNDYSRDSEKVLKIREELRNKRTLGSKVNYQREFKLRQKPRIPYQVSFSKQKLLFTILVSNLFLALGLASEVEVENLLNIWTLALFIVLNLFFIFYFKKSLSKKNSIKLKPDGIELNGVFKEWDNYLGYSYIREEDYSFHKTNGRIDNGPEVKHFLEIELIGAPSIFRFNLGELTDSRENILGTLLWYERKFSKNKTVPNNK